MQRDQALAILTQHQQQIMEWGIKSLAIFGSVARNEARQDSDVDLLVEFEEGKSIGLFELVEIKEDLERLLGCQVDLVTPKSLKPRIRDRIFADAVSAFPLRDWKLDIQDLENMPPRSWKDRIEDILEAIAKIERYIAGMTYEEFQADDLKIDAVMRNLTIIGEAARYTPPEVEASHSEIAWVQMRGIRNLLVHQYPDIKLDIIWDTLQNNLPLLSHQLRELLMSEDSQRQSAQN